MKFSVLIPAYQATSTIARCIRSLSGQTLSDFEVLLIADDALDYEPFCRGLGLNIRYLRTPSTGSGPSVARNLGIQAAQGEFISYLDADDSFSANRLDLFYQSLKESPLVGDYPTSIDFNGAEIPPPNYCDHDLSLSDYLQLNFPVKIAHPNCKSLFFDESLRFAEDTLFNALAICFFDARLKILAKTEYRYYLSHGSLTSQSFPKIDASYGQLLNRISSTVNCKPEQKKLLYQHFWLKRSLNKVYFDFVAEFGPCSFLTFSKMIEVPS